MYVKGTIITIEPVVQVTDTFKKRGVLLQTEDKYNNETYVEFINDGCAKLDDFAEGQKVSVGVNVFSKSYEDKKTGNMKWFANIKGWSIIADNGESDFVQPQKETKVAQDDDDLPF